MKIFLLPGETLLVGFHEAAADGPRDHYELDGTLTISFKKDECIMVEADLPDSAGRTGVIYEERFAQSERDLLEMAEKAARTEMQAALDKALAEPRPATNMDQYRMTPERKEFSDKRVAENIRFHYRETDKLVDYTDTEVADGFERWRDDDTNDPNLGSLESRTAFRGHLFDLYGHNPEPGEHAEVVAALNGDVEDHG